MSRNSALSLALVGLGLSALVFGCQIPLSSTGTMTGKGTVTLGFMPPTGRTVVPDLQPLLSAIESIDLQIERTDQVSTPYTVNLSGAGVASTTKTLTDLEAGTYTIDATAYDNLSAPIAYGKQLTLVINAGDVRSDTIVLAPSLTTGTGNLNLLVTYPATAGVTAVTANLKNRSGDTSQDFASRTLTITNGGARDGVTVVENNLNVGNYDLEVVFTENGNLRTYQQAVNIFQGQTADHVVDDAGSLQTEWALTEDYFGSSTFLADAVLTTTDTTQVPSGTIEGQGFSSPIRTYNLVTKAGWYQLTVTTAYAGQSVEFWDAAAATPAWVGLTSGVPTGTFNLDFDPEYATLNLRVTSPGGSRGYYTFNLVRAGGAGVTNVVAPVVSLITPTLGQASWTQNETLTASATSSTTGTWAWFFDGALVTGQTSNAFSAPVSGLSTTLGNHLLMVLFTDTQGFTWARHLAVQFIDAADVVVSIKTKQTRVNLTGAKAWAYNTAGADSDDQLSIGFDDLYLQKVWYGIDNFNAPTLLNYGVDYTTAFNVSGLGLSPGIHTLMLQVLLQDNTLAGVLVSFEVKARDAGSAQSPFVVALADRYFPSIYADNTSKPWDPYWYAAEVTSLDFSVKIPDLGNDAPSAVLRYSFAGQTYTTPVTSGTTTDLSIALSDFNAGLGLPPGTYTLTLELWAGPSPGERRSVGSLNILVQFLGGLNEV